MILSTSKILRPCGDQQVKEFINESLNAFGKELEVVAESMYRYPNNLMGIDGKESINDVFALIERSYVGLYSNAVVRCFPDDAVLQEFPIYQKDEISNKEKFLGRADLFIVHKAGNNVINLLFEAKAFPAEWKKSDSEKLKSYYKGVHDQAFSYYNSEKDFYTGDTYIITINFDWIRNPHLLDEVLKEEYGDDGCTDFYTIYHTKNEAGLMVYGNITKVEG
jgi:hypothetical protein